MLSINCKYALMKQKFPALQIFWIYCISQSLGFFLHFLGKSRIEDQVLSGVAVRMAILFLLEQYRKSGK